MRPRSSERHLSKEPSIRDLGLTALRVDPLVCGIQPTHYIFPRRTRELSKLSRIKYKLFWVKNVWTAGRSPLDPNSSNSVCFIHSDNITVHS